MKAFGTAWVCYDGKALSYSPVKLDFGGELQKEFKVDLPEGDGGPAQKGNKFTVRVSRERGPASNFPLTPLSPQLQYIGPVQLGALSKFVKGATVDSSELGSAIQARESESASR